MPTAAVECFLQRLVTFGGFFRVARLGVLLDMAEGYCTIVHTSRNFLGAAVSGKSLKVSMSRHVQSTRAKIIMWAQVV